MARLRVVIVVIIVVVILTYAAATAARKWYRDWKPRWEEAKRRTRAQAQASAGEQASVPPFCRVDEENTGVDAFQTGVASHEQHAQEQRPSNGEQRVRPRSEVDLAAEAALDENEAAAQAFEMTLNIARAESLQTAIPSAPPQPESPPGPLIARDDVPHDYRCPITLELMKDPVVADDGFTYERTAINAWMRGRNPVSPVTGARLRSKNVIANHTLKAAIATYVDSYNNGTS
ncbi:WD repeat, SAM and U-box domain-containing protein 1 [Pycnococcus provasolii]|uniref:WD repeat, SAM and U-box domain-containing protein 1 n=1 Tax=Pycnococcus provasolii TaxID=41880 RepID=A0A830HVE9_9CHLO|nr:WD repeat, SAM and U-box domain-containing protein 1 [Pycnococcus provasolii]